MCPPRSSQHRHTLWTHQSSMLSPMHLLRLWSCCSGSVNEQVGLYEEQCTNLNDRLNYLIHRTMFPVGVFKSFAPSTRPQVDHTTGRTLGWRTGPNCNLGNRSSSIEGTVFLNVSFLRLVYHGEISLCVFIPALIGAVRISGFADVCHKLPTQQPFDS